MSLNSLVTTYITNGALATAISNGDEVARTRMLTELAAAVEAEVIPAMQDRVIGASAWNDSIKVFTAMFPNHTVLGTSITPPANKTLNQGQMAKIKKIVTVGYTYASSLSQLRGEFPTAAGVTEPAEAIYPGTKVWAVFEGPVEYISIESLVVEDNGEDPIEVAPIDLVDGDPTYVVPRYHIWFEYLDAETDLGTAEYMDTLQVGDSITDGVDTIEIATIDYDARTIADTTGLVLLTFEDAMADWTKV